ncbi:MAG: NAD(P)-dependent oxidoreductase [Burkholderiaceae bacterium]
MEQPYDIVIGQPIDPEIVDSLSRIGTVYVNPGPDPIPPQDLAQLCGSSRALMAFMTERIDRKFLQACPNLKIVAGALKGFDNVDLAACAENGVTFTYIPDLLTLPTAELALGLMIALARNVRDGDAHVRSGNFQGWRPTRYGGSINGATVGIVGAGAVGRAVLKLLTGFECRRIYCDPVALPPDQAASLQAEHLPFSDLIKNADFIVLAVPLTDQTKHLINTDVLAQIKPGAYLVNPARGSIVVESDIATALTSGHLGGYAADVFELEDRSRPDAPHSIANGIIASPNTVLTPHLGSAVRDVRRAIEQAAADEIWRALT